MYIHTGSHNTYCVHGLVMGLTSSPKTSQIHFISYNIKETSYANCAHKRNNIFKKSTKAKVPLKGIIHI